MKALNNQVILLTGATGGIGSKVAKRLSNESITLLLVARNEERLHHLVQSLKPTSSATLVLMSYDLTDFVQVQKMTKEIINRYGKIDQVVHAAGVGDFKPFTDFSVEEMDEMIKGNTLSVMYLFSTLLPYMKIRQQGRWTIIASSGGEVATPSSSVYSASKFAIIGLTNAIRMEIRSEQLELTVVNPGPVDTPFHYQNPQMKAYLEKVKWMALKPDTVAKKVVRNMKRIKMKGTMTLPWFLSLAARGYALAPNLADWVIAHFFNYKEESP